MTATIIFDFDGTVAVGDGPVWAYARVAAESAGDAYLDRVATGLTEYAAGNAEYRDGYDVVGSLARADGVDEATLSRAYQHSRTQLGTDEAPVAPAPGLAELVARLDPSIRLVLATNAPADGIDRALEAWGLAESFAGRHFTVGKPTGLEPIIRAALESGPVLSIGDIYEFDLAPAAALGATTALVGATAESSTEQPTLRGRTLAELVPDILAWSATAASSPASPHRTTSIER
ncbi:HAD family hydrolase [Gulosibacter sp. ACHW.36C]|uniref:HAD family hydrolase n=1 Tax=Gulosibacter sediminis TaxID=1729695 RepID=A0ABY4MU96_9MICO|nr:HAD family hydrolase [Gulosibacter sediminis]UQN13944.1 HAD family hydrolase [Gulosibacter sediminis]